VRGILGALGGRGTTTSIYERETAKATDEFREAALKAELTRFMDHVFGARPQPKRWF
jgi:hypothetical protein